MTKPPRTPDLSAQRLAMQKLAFLVGEWRGEAHIFRGGAEPVELLQAEHAEYRLDGLVLLIEGTGHGKADGKIMLRALGIVSYDDENGAYHMRAYNDGRYMETEVKLGADGRGLSWGFALGDIRTTSLLQLNERGQWTEWHEITIGDGPSRKLMELSASKQK